MNIIEIKVPEEIEYISQWEGFELPKGHSIIDKTICGCGFTEYCLTNQKKAIIIAVPRRALGDNKIKQHKGEDGLYYFKNERDSSENYDNNEKAKLDNDSLDKSVKQDYLAEIKAKLYNWLQITLTNSIIPKIIVTYDSLHHVQDVIKYFDIDFHVVVDEFQSIFLDASFKAEVELGIVEDLSNQANVTYLSATPMLEKYLNQLDYFRDLPFYKFIWPDNRIERIRVERRVVKSISSGLQNFIDDYRAGIFPTKVLSDGTVTKSTELVMFVNSIKSIIDIIRDTGLTKEEVNIICANTPTNVRKLKKYGLEIGNIPLKGEPHKMFTFCTRTTYLGADFYSTSAYSIVCSDLSIKSLMLDISLDLPQIIGRQRLKENLFRNEILFLYKASNSKDATMNLTEKEYQDFLDSQDKSTIALLNVYTRLGNEVEKEGLLKLVKNRKDQYESDFLSLSKRTGLPVYNYLVKIAKQRAYDVTRKDYQDIVTIKRGIENIRNVKIQVTDEKVFNEFDDAAEKLVRTFETSKVFEERMRILCQTLQKYPTLASHSLINVMVPLRYFNYYNLLGPGLIGTLKYIEKSIKSAYDKKLIEGNINFADAGLFIIGERYTKADIKDKLKGYYDENNIVRTAKASDIDLYYETKPCLITDPKTGKRNSGFIIVRRKE